MYGFPIDSNSSITVFSASRYSFLGICPIEPSVITTIPIVEWSFITFSVPKNASSKVMSKLYLKSAPFFGANNSELYFEENDFDDFILRLKQIPNISYVHPVIEHSWGQRVVRFYDPDKHIIEVAEDLTKVVRKFLNKGMSAETVATRMDIPVDYVKSCL